MRAKGIVTKDPVRRRGTSAKTGMPYDLLDYTVMITDEQGHHNFLTFTCGTEFMTNGTVGDDGVKRGGDKVEAGMCVEVRYELNLREYRNPQTGVVSYFNDVRNVFYVGLAEQPGAAPATVQPSGQARIAQPSAAPAAVEAEKTDDLPF